MLKTKDWYVSKESIIYAIAGTKLSYDGEVLSKPGEYYEDEINLLSRLAGFGGGEAKFRRVIPVWVTVDAPLYWWKQMDTYKVGSVSLSSSTMHTLHKKTLSLDNFSTEHLGPESIKAIEETIAFINRITSDAKKFDSMSNDTKRELFQLLPDSFNQTRVLMLNYEILAKIILERSGHLLTEWETFINWIEDLPYAHDFMFCK